MARTNEDWREKYGDLFKKHRKPIIDDTNSAVDEDNSVIAARVRKLVNSNKSIFGLIKDDKE